jgi:hypothetical protein
MSVILTLTLNNLMNQNILMGAHRSCGQYEVFEQLLRLWMDIWLHTHTVTTTDVSPDLERFVEILPDASLQTMPLRFG